MTTTPSRQLCDSHDVSAKVTKLVQTRTKLALDRYNGRVKEAYERTLGASQANPVFLRQLYAGAAQYAVDFAQRSILFWDTLRQRGNNFLEHERQGLPPVLHFEYETIMDGRSLQASGQLRAAAHHSAERRHGGPEAPSVRDHRSAGRPRPGHRRLQGRFAGRRGTARRPSRLLRRLLPRIPSRAKRCSTCATPSASSCIACASCIPNAAKPAIVGNCQAGWAAMMLAAASPDDTGPVVMVGAPMSYWGGAWREGEGDNPMRYAGGLLGGTWLASLAPTSAPASSTAPSSCRTSRT